MKLLTLTLSVTCLLLAGCDNDHHSYRSPTEPASPTVPVTPPPPTVIVNTIEFRVIGSPTLVRIRYSDPTDGLTQVVTSLPFVAGALTVQNTVFLSLDVTPLTFPTFNQAPFLSAQIVVNGFLFREANTTDISFNTLFVSGTWRSIVK